MTQAATRPEALKRGLWDSFWLPALVLVLTMAQLAVAEWAPGIERFADKAFAARLIAYPVLMLLTPAIWWLVRGRQTLERGERPPYVAFALIMLPFLVDVTGNSLDLYDTVVWWDDFNHFINWVLLCLGLALVVAPRLRPAWELVDPRRPPGLQREWVRRIRRIRRRHVGLPRWRGAGEERAGMV